MFNLFLSILIAQDFLANESLDSRWQGISGQDVLSYSIDLTPDFSTKTVFVRVDYALRVDKGVDEIHLHSLAGDLWTVDFFYVDGSPWKHSRNGDFLTLPRVELDAAVEDEELRFYAEMRGNPPDGLYFRDSRYGQPILFTDHFSSRARGWLPSEDHPSDRALFSLKINDVDGLEVVGSGIDLKGDGVLRTAVELQTYLFAFSVGSYARISEQGDSRLAPHFIYDQDKPKARRGLRFHSSWIAQMESFFGPYPYSKYCVVQVPTRWGGMENAGNTWIMEALFDGDDRGVGTLAHELVHQWFGDSVGYAEWQDAWLSEGFASYLGPWLHATSGGGVPLDQAMSELRNRWLNAKLARSRPIRWNGFSHPDELFGSSAPNTYQKAAWVLHMLRGRLGDRDFFDGISSYYKKFFNSGVSTNDFVNLMEESSGEKLHVFFNQWLNFPDCPKLKISWEGNSLHVRQVQEGEMFTFRLPVSWIGSDGKRKKEYFSVSESSHVFDLPDDLLSPRIDPDIELLFERF